MVAINYKDIADDYYVHLVNKVVDSNTGKTEIGKERDALIGIEVRYEDLL